MEDSTENSVIKLNAAQCKCIRSVNISIVAPSALNASCNYFN